MVVYIREHNPVEFTLYYFLVVLMQKMSSLKLIVVKLSTPLSISTRLHCFYSLFPILTRHCKACGRTNQEKWKGWDKFEWYMGRHLRQWVGLDWCWGRLQTAGLPWCQAGKVGCFLRSREWSQLNGSGCVWRFRGQNHRVSITLLEKTKVQKHRNCRSNLL